MPKLTRAAKRKLHNAHFAGGLITVCSIGLVAGTY